MILCHFELDLVRARSLNIKINGDFSEKVDSLLGSWNPAQIALVELDGDVIEIIGLFSILFLEDQEVN